MVCFLLESFGVHQLYTSFFKPASFQKVSQLDRQTVAKSRTFEDRLFVSHPIIRVYNLIIIESMGDYVFFIKNWRVCRICDLINKL